MHIFTILYQYLSMLSSWGSVQFDFLAKTTYKYVLTNDGYPHEMTTYVSIKPNTKKGIVFLSGSYELYFDVYMKKTMYDLYNFTTVFDNYDVIILEKRDKASLMIHEDIIQYINWLTQQKQYDEIVLFGYSYGGVVASHVAQALASTGTYKIKIITYDTGYQQYDNILSFQDNYIYRMDMYYYWIIHTVYSTQYNYVEIKDKMTKDQKTCNGADELIQMLENIHSFGYEKTHFLTGFNLAQPPTTKIVNIMCDGDPIVNRNVHNEYIMKHLGKNKDIVNSLDITNIVKYDVVGHCSDMTNNTNYIVDIVFALSL